MKHITSFFTPLFILCFSFVACSPVRDSFGEWSPDTPHTIGQLSLDRHNISLETVSIDDFGDVVSTSYKSFPYSLKRIPSIKNSWNIVNNADGTVCGRISADHDTLSLCSYSWIRTSPADSSDFMLDADMSWLEGNWNLPSDGISSPAQSFSFKSDCSYHAGTFQHSASIGIPIQGVFYVCDGLVKLSYGGIVPSRVLRIHSDCTLSTLEGQALYKQ